jgi:hypothetical protein
MRQTITMRTDVTVIIRAAGERTLAACRALLAEQVPEDHIVVIQETPANQMVRRTHQVALEQGQPWTLAVDADVLIRAGAVADILAAGENHPDPFFVLSGDILDKLAGGPRHGGLRLLRTPLCAIALEHIPDETVVRPDSHVMRAMERQGHANIHIESTMGLHDFEQSYRDLYRKGFKHANKYKPMRDTFIQLWTDLAPQDPDYRVALWGMKTGLVFDGDLVVDANRYPAQLETLLNMAAMQEKPPLPANQYTGEAVHQIIQQWTSPQGFFDFIELQQFHSRAVSLREFIINDGLKKTGWLRFPVWLIGAFLSRSGSGIRTAGKSLMQRATRPAEST